MKSKYIVVLLLLLQIAIYGQTNTTVPNQFDYGKMWTFENPPKEWFTKAYNFTPGDEWFNDVRKSSLRFATWCSASFISPDGLIMTNHHCSRDVVVQLQKDGENFDKQGFYAQTLGDERRAKDLFVEQLIQTADITSEVQKLVSGVDKNKIDETTKKALQDIKDKYQQMSGWEGLR
ncbi:MAG: hypothetical protein RLZZ546_408, partial [Bacteroidota bacterium]